MTFPKKLKIGGHIYKIKLVDPEDIDNDCGQQNRSRNVIKIRNDLPHSQMWETLVHEVLHAINGEFKEETVDFLATAIFAILNDNRILKS